MLRITASESSEAIKQYFRDVLSKGDYYLKGQKIPALCAGLGAEKLGITGPTSKKIFDRLADNLKPDGSQLTEYTVENRRPCYDFTFSVSKSISILSAITGDARIKQTMQTVARAMMKEMELEMHTRVRVGGANHDRQTGNMVYIEVPHSTTRPAPAMNGLPEGTPDMHEHIHYIVINATYDAAEDKWKAGQFGKLMNGLISRPVRLPQRTAK